MPTGNLPASGKALFERVYEEAKKGSCKDQGDRKEECAARVAWTAVKNAGWKKDNSGNWHKSANLEEFSLTIKRASFDNNQKMRWRADTSDIDDDSYGDNMTLELFNDFISRIRRNELAPEAFRSDFWQGGMPYLSISHYPDLNGKAVPGIVDSVFVDGKFLRATGEYSDTPLGRACFKAAHKSVRSDDDEDKVRISIAFLDWMHKHKSNSYMFERKELDDICPECILELIKGEYHGRTFLKGQLVHLAQTKVPVNKRTEITAEVDRAMAKTRKDDAASIIGEELADEIDQEAKLVGKSEALVIKAEDEPKVEEKADMEGSESDNKHPEDEYPDCKDKETGELDPDCVQIHEQQEKSEVQKNMSEPAMAEYRPYGGATSIKEAKKIQEAKDEAWRLESLWYMLDDIMSNIFVDETVTDKAASIKSAVNEFKDLVEQKSLLAINNMMLDIKALITPKEEPAPVVHPLDQAITELKADYDRTAAMELSVEEKLHTFQQDFAKFGNRLADILRATAIVRSDASLASQEISTLTQIVTQLSQKVDLLSTQLKQQSAVVPTQDVVPQRRSINPQLVQQSMFAQPATQSETPNLRKIIERTT